MTDSAKSRSLPSEAIERALVQGNLAALTPAQRASYYHSVCESLGLNPLTRPFEYITLNGKLTLYARKDCTDQLRTLHSISIEKPDISFQDDWIVVAVQARDAAGRTDADIGVVSRKDMRGDFGNALMKAVTKAKRRVTLSMCGLGILDESEIESVPGAAPIEEVKEPRSIDAEFSGCATLADLAKLWGSLSPAEQRQHLAAKDRRKAVLGVSEPSVEAHQVVDERKREAESPEAVKAA